MYVFIYICIYIYTMQLCYISICVYVAMYVCVSELLVYYEQLTVHIHTRVCMYVRLMSVRLYSIAPIGFILLLVHMYIHTHIHLFTHSTIHYVPVYINSILWKSASIYSKCIAKYIVTIHYNNIRIMHVCCIITICNTCIYNILCY